MAEDRNTGKYAKTWKEKDRQPLVTGRESQLRVYRERQKVVRRRPPAEAEGRNQLGIGREFLVTFVCCRSRRPRIATGTASTVPGGSSWQPPVVAEIATCHQKSIATWNHRCARCAQRARIVTG